MSEAELAAFQAHLLETLFTSDEAEVILERLQEFTLPEAMTGYVKTFDPRMVEVAAELLTKWGQRS